MPKKDLNQLICEAINTWDGKQMIAFMRDVLPLFELFDVDENNDWVVDEVGQENEQNVRLIRTVYLVSRLAELHAGKLASFKCQFPNLYRKLQEFSEKS